MKSNDIIITGCDTGLGRYLNHTIPASIGLNRKNSKDILASDISYDCIIHCAFSRGKDGKDIDSIIEDNVLLTQKLLKLNHKKFIFISSVDVYAEEKNLYNSSKILCESMVESCALNSLVIRCGAMLGNNMKSNSLTKLLTKNCLGNMTLHPGSSFYYILYSDIADFINYSLKNDVRGIIDFVSSSPVTLGEIAKNWSLPSSFGTYLYTTPLVSNKKLQTIFPQADKSSLTVIKEFSETL